MLNSISHDFAVALQFPGIVKGLLYTRRILSYLSIKVDGCNYDMPHLRERHCLNICLKKLKFAPVLAIQGGISLGGDWLIQIIPP